LRLAAAALLVALLVALDAMATVLLPALVQSANLSWLAVSQVAKFCRRGFSFRIAAGLRTPANTLSCSA